MGNLFSIQRAVSQAGDEAVITDDRREIERAARLILPGVGAFGDAMAELRRRELVRSVAEFAAGGRPILGICLGMQLLFSESFEFGHNEGLNLVPGRVVRFKSEADDRAFKVPQIGWNRIAPPAGRGAADWQGTILGGIGPEDYFYFVHSFICVPESKEDVLAETSYGYDRFCSVVRRKNVWGCQFHPEKSGEQGLSIYRAFLAEH